MLQVRKFIINENCHCIFFQLVFEVFKMRVENMGKILVIDDDEGTTKLLRIILSREGYDVVSTNDGSDALSTALTHNPNLVILDLKMPDIDGFEICKSLRSKPQFASTPIVFFSSISDVEKKVLAFELGATDYIIKPVHPEELKLRIKMLIGNGKNGIHGELYG